MRLILPEKKLQEWLTKCITEHFMKGVEVVKMERKRQRGNTYSYTIDLKETGSSKEGN